MSAQLVQVQVSVPKELNEALDALVDIASDLKAGKSVTEIAASRFQELAAAVNGIQSVPSEIAGVPFEAIGAGALHGVNIVRVLLGK